MVKKSSPSSLPRGESCWVPKRALGNWAPVEKHIVIPLRGLPRAPRRAADFIPTFTPWIFSQNNYQKLKICQEFDSRVLFSLPVWPTSAGKCIEIGLHGLKKKKIADLLCHLLMESLSSSVLRIKGSATHLHHSLWCKELTLLLFIYLCVSLLQPQNQNRNSPDRLHLPVSTFFIQYYTLSLVLCSWIIMTPLKQWFLPPAMSQQL